MGTQEILNEAPKDADNYFTEAYNEDTMKIKQLRPKKRPAMICDFCGSFDYPKNLKKRPDGKTICKLCEVNS